jgi:hypothetical protein
MMIWITPKTAVKYFHISLPVMFTKTLAAEWIETLFISSTLRWQGAVQATDVTHIIMYVRYVNYAQQRLVLTLV